MMLLKLVYPVWLQVVGGKENSKESFAWLAKLLRDFEQEREHPFVCFCLWGQGRICMRRSTDCLYASFWSVCTPEVSCAVSSRGNSWVVLKFPLFMKGEAQNNRDSFNAMSLCQPLSYGLYIVTYPNGKGLVSA